MSTPSATASEDAKQKLLDLMQQQKALEAKIIALRESFEVDRAESLIDAEGFPRADVDVYTERHNRNSYAMLQNDHKNLMKDVEKALYELHALSKSPQKNDNVSTPRIQPERKQQIKTTTTTKPSLESKFDASSDIPLLEAIFVVRSVADGGPAKAAGLCVDDRVLQFGELRKDNVSADRMRALVAAKKPIVVTLDRANVLGTLEVKLTPAEWSGQGLLGCVLVPIA